MPAVYLGNLLDERVRAHVSSRAGRHVRSLPSFNKKENFLVFLRKISKYDMWKFIDNKKLMPCGLRKENIVFFAHQISFNWNGDK